MTVHIVSFGYGHAPAPQADMTLDLRRRYRNPHDNPAMRDMTGLDIPVWNHVLDTPGITSAVGAAMQAALGMASVGLDYDIAVGCVGGRHRSVAVALEIGRALQGCEIPVKVEHRDVHRPVIQR